MIYKFIYFEKSKVNMEYNIYIVNCLNIKYTAFSQVNIFIKCMLKLYYEINFDKLFRQNFISIHVNIKQKLLLLILFIFGVYYFIESIMNMKNKASFCKLYFKINFTKKNPVNKSYKIFMI